MSKGGEVELFYALSSEDPLTRLQVREFFVIRTSQNIVQCAMQTTFKTELGSPRHRCSSMTAKSCVGIFRTPHRSAKE